MANVKITKEEADRLMKIEDKTRGALIETIEEYIVQKKGIEGLEKVKEKLEEIGYPMDFGKFSTFTWYQGALDILLIIVFLDVFDLDELVAFDLGRDSLVSNSLLVKLLLSRLVSFDTAIKNAPKIWRYFSKLGEIRFTQYDKEKKFAILRLDNYAKLHVVAYHYVRGSLAKLIEMLTKSKNVKIEQTKSLYNDDSYDEFKITW